MIGVLCLVSRWFVCLFVGFICFCKQKTAYEMRISDWSSDVCSSDLDGLDRRCPSDQARQPHAALSRAFGRRSEGARDLPRDAEMTSETGFDPKLYERFPTAEDRPPDELEKLEAIWKAPRGWARLTVDNNTDTGADYGAT